jgi:hypothetical protein
LEEAMKGAPKRTSPPASLEARAAMVIALSKSSSPQIRAAAEWLAGKNTAEVRKRYGDAIEAAIGKASVSRERETVEASDGAEAYAHPHARVIAWGVNADGGFNLLRSVRRPDGADETES